MDSFPLSVGIAKRATPVSESFQRDRDEPPELQGMRNVRAGKQPNDRYQTT